MWHQIKTTGFKVSIATYSISHDPLNLDIIDCLDKLRYMYTHSRAALQEMFDSTVELHRNIRLSIKRRIWQGQA